MLRRRILASAMASVMAIGSVAVVASAEDAAVATAQVKTKADLEAYVKSFDKFREDGIYDYGSISGENFLNAIEYADNVLADDKAGVDEYTVAYAMIEAVYNKLTIYSAEELKAQLDGCKKIYDQNNIMNEDLGDLVYTADSFAAFANAYEEAESLVSSSDSRLITDAYEKLVDKKNALSANTVITKSGFRTALKEYETVLQKQYKYDSWRVGTINDTTWTLWYAQGDIVAYGTLYQHVASLENFINTGYKKMDSIKSLNKTTDGDIADAYNACKNAVLLFNSFEADDTNRATKANVKNLLKEYNGRLVHDYATTAAETLFKNVVNNSGAKIQVLKGDKYTSNYVDATASTDPWFVVSDTVTIKPNTQDKYSAKVLKDISAQITIKATDKSFYLALDKEGYAVGAFATKADAERVPVSVTYKNGVNGILATDGATEYDWVVGNGVFLKGTWTWVCSEAQMAGMGITPVVDSTVYSTSKLINKGVAIDLTDYVKVDAAKVVSETDNHLWNNVIDGDYTTTSPAVPGTVSDVKGYGPDILQIGGGNAWDTISTAAYQDMNGFIGGFKTYADLGDAYRLATKYINSTSGDASILDIDSTNSLAGKVTGSTAEWTMVYRYLKYALADKYDATYGKHTKAEVEQLIEDCYELAELTGDAALFTQSHNVLVNARQDALEWVKAANKDKLYKDNASSYTGITYAGMVSTQVYDALADKYNTLKKEYDAFKYSFDDVYMTIADVKAKIEDEELVATDTLLAALEDTAYALSVVKPVYDTNGNVVSENEAFAADRTYQGYNRVYTEPGEFDSLAIDPTTKVKIAKGFKDGSAGPNISHYNLTKAYEALLAEVKAQEEPAVVVGDLNGDNVVDQRDAAIILKKVVDGETIDIAIGDFDGDGYADQRDASAILKYVVNQA